jgi:hypothetical protein
MKTQKKYKKKRSLTRKYTKKNKRAFIFDAAKIHPASLRF